MAKLSIVAGATSQSVNLFVQDSSKTDGSGLTGLVFNTSGLTCYYSFAGANATATVVSLATLAAVNSAWSSGGFKELDATNMPGWYRFDLPNAVIAAAKGRSVGVHFQGATHLAPVPLEIELTGWDNQDSVHGGMSAVPNAAAGAVGGLPLSVDTSGRVDVLKINGTSQTARDLGASVLLSPGTGTGQLSITSGVVQADAAKVNGVSTAAVTTVKPVLGLAVDGVIPTATNLTNAPTAGDFTATMKTSLNAATPASVTGAVASVTGNVGGNVVGSVGSVVGAVGSVTGAVGSVTGNVGGNVVGTVGSVVGAVGSVTGAVGSVTGNVGGNVTGTVGSVVGAVGSVTGNVGGNVSGNVTGSVGSVVAGVALTVSERNSTADAILDRDMSVGVDSGSPTVRTMRQALRFLRNLWAISGGTLTVTKEDDTTTSWTATVTQTAGNPVSKIDPA